MSGSPPTAPPQLLAPQPMAQQQAIDDDIQYSYFLPQGLGIGIDGDDPPPARSPPPRLSSSSAPHSPAPPIIASKMSSSPPAESSALSLASQKASATGTSFAKVPLGGLFGVRSKPAAALPLFAPSPFSHFKVEDSASSGPEPNITSAPVLSPFSDRWKVEDSHAQRISQSSSSHLVSTPRIATKSVLSAQSKSFVPRGTYIEAFNSSEQDDASRARRRSSKPNIRPSVGRISSSRRGGRFGSTKETHPPFHRQQEVIQQSNRWKARTIAVASSMPQNNVSPPINQTLRRKDRNWVPKERIWKPIPAMDNDDLHHSYESAPEAQPVHDNFIHDENEFDDGSIAPEDEHRRDNNENHDEPDEHSAHDDHEEHDSHENHDELEENDEHEDQDSVDAENEEQEDLPESHFSDGEKGSDQDHHSTVSSGFDENCTNEPEHIENDDFLEESIDGISEIELSHEQGSRDGSVSVEDDFHPDAEELVDEIPPPQPTLESPAIVVEKSSPSTSIVAESKPVSQAKSHVPAPSRDKTAAPKPQPKKISPKELKQKKPDQRQKGSRRPSISNSKLNSKSSKGFEKDPLSSRAEAPEPAVALLPSFQSLDSISFDDHSFGLSSKLSATTSFILDSAVAMLSELLSIWTRLHFRAWNTLFVDHDVLFCFGFCLFFPAMVRSLSGWAAPWVPHCLWYAFIIHSLCRDGHPFLVALSRVVLPLSFITGGIQYDCLLLELNIAERIVLAFLICGFQRQEFGRSVYLQCLAIEILFAVSYGSSIVVQWILLILSLGVIHCDQSAASDLLGGGSKLSGVGEPFSQRDSSEDSPEFALKGPVPVSASIPRNRRRFGRKARI